MPKNNRIKTLSNRDKNIKLKMNPVIIGLLFDESINLNINAKAKKLRNASDK